MGESEVPRSDRPNSGMPAWSLAGSAAVLFATLCWTFATISVKLADASSIWITFWRFLIALPLAFVLLFWHGRRHGLSHLRRGWVGGVAFAVHVLVYFSALTLTSVAVVTFVAALTPVCIMVIAGRAFGERVTPAMVAWGGLSLVGVAIVIVGGDTGAETTAIGNALAVLNLVLWTAYFATSKYLREDLDAVGYQGAVLIVSAVVVTPVALVLAAAGIGVSGGQVSGTGWYWILAIAFVSSAGHLLLNWAHRFVAASLSAIIVLALPVFSAVGAALFLGEAFGPVQAAGGALVLISTGTIVFRPNGQADYPAEDA